jgi:hypothetical protein
MQYILLSVFVQRIHDEYINVMVIKIAWKLKH